jgi:hypothetical protein
MSKDRLLLHWVLQPKFIEQPNNYIRDFYTLHFPPKQSFKTWYDLINMRDEIEKSFKERGFDQQLWEKEEGFFEHPLRETKVIQITTLREKHQRESNV